MSKFFSKKNVCTITTSTSITIGFGIYNQIICDDKKHSIIINERNSMKDSINNNHFRPIIHNYTNYITNNNESIIGIISYDFKNKNPLFVYEKFIKKNNNNEKNENKQNNELIIRKNYHFHSENSIEAEHFMVNKSIFNVFFVFLFIIFI